MSASSEKSKGSAFGSRFRAGSYSAFATVILIVIAVVLNLAAGALPASVTQIDMTANSLYTLSDQTRRIARSLDEDVYMYLLCNTGAQDATIEKLLNAYAGQSQHLHAETVDPVEKPTFLEKYNLELSKLYANSVLVTSGDRSRLVAYNEIYVTEYQSDSSSNYGYTATTKFDGENALTNAIHYVTSDDLPKVYLLTGHGEAALSDTLSASMAQDNMDTEELSLLTAEEVPQDATAVLINQPTGDINAEEADMLIRYLDGGGSVALLGNGLDGNKMENLQKVTAHMGLTLGEGLVLEGDRNMHMNRYPHYLLPTVESHTVTEPLVEGKYYIIAPVSQPLVEAAGDAEVTWLLTTSDSAYAKAAGMDATTTAKEDGDTDGPFHIAAVSEKNGGKLFWVASQDFLNENMDYMVSGANSSLLLNALDWMGGQENAISIRAKSLDESTLVVSSGKSSVWTVILVGLVPLTFVAVGVTVWIRRKRR